MHIKEQSDMDPHFLLQRRKQNSYKRHTTDDI